MLIVEAASAVASGMITAIIFDVAKVVFDAIHAGSMWYFELGIIVVLDSLMGLVEAYTFGIFYSFGLILWGMLLNQRSSILCGVLSIIWIAVVYLYKSSQSNDIYYS